MSYIEKDSAVLLEMINSCLENILKRRDNLFQETVNEKVKRSKELHKRFRIFKVLSCDEASQIIENDPYEHLYIDLSFVSDENTLKKLKALCKISDGVVYVNENDASIISQFFEL